MRNKKWIRTGRKDEVLEWWALPSANEEGETTDVSCEISTPAKTEESPECENCKGGHCPDPDNHPPNSSIMCLDCGGSMCGLCKDPKSFPVPGEVRGLPSDIDRHRDDLRAVLEACDPDVDPLEILAMVSAMLERIGGNEIPAKAAILGSHEPSGWCPTCEGEGCQTCQPYTKERGRK